MSEMNKALALEILRQATENTPMVRKSHHAVEAALIYLDRATVETSQIQQQGDADGATAAADSE